MDNGHSVSCDCIECTHKAFKNMYSHTIINSTGRSNNKDTLIEWARTHSDEEIKLVLDYCERITKGQVFLEEAGAISQEAYESLRKKGNSCPKGKLYIPKNVEEVEKRAENDAIRLMRRFS